MLAGRIFLPAFPMKYYDLQSIISDSDSGEIIAERKKRFDNVLDLKDYVHKFVDSSFRGVYTTNHFSVTFDIKDFEIIHEFF